MSLQSTINIGKIPVLLAPMAGITDLPFRNVVSKFGVDMVFSEMIAVWIVSFWEKLNKPKKFNIVELGPGSGLLSKIAIKTFKNFPEFYKSSNIFLYERSKKLKLLQRKNLLGSSLNTPIFLS